jgi:hypothetical protein
MFRNVQEFADSFDDGRYNITTFRKQVSSAVTLANDFVDYTYFAGNPIANFYASEPLVAATIERNKGLNIPDIDQYIKSVTLMSGAASATVATNQRQTIHMMDYLLYYPFIDTDAVGEVQTLDNTITLPRYIDGHGVQVIAVGQSASSAVGTYTFTYTNSEGVSGRVSRPTFTKIINGGGVIVSSTSNGVGGSQAFDQLQAGDKGVRSIDSINFTQAGGGLMALVLVFPLWNNLNITQECRRTASGNLESYGAAVMTEAVIHRPTKEIKQGAVVGFLGLGNAGSLASSVLVGNLETVWSA